jgi:hypothetical protein
MPLCHRPLAGAALAVGIAWLLRGPAVAPSLAAPSTSCPRPIQLAAALAEFGDRDTPSSGAEDACEDRRITCAMSVGSLPLETKEVADVRTRCKL